MAARERVVSMVIERDWTWVRPGDFVYDQNGQAWQFVGRDGLGSVTLAGVDGRQVSIGKQSGPVKVWDPRPESPQVEAFAATLGARILHDSH